MADPRQTLQDLIRRFGTSLAGESQRCKGMLMDLCGSSRREIAGLVVAIEEKITTELMKPHPILVSLRANMILRLVNNRGLDHELAVWTVDTWGLVLGTWTQADLDSFPPIPPQRQPPLGRTDGFSPIVSPSPSFQPIEDANTFFDRGNAKYDLGDKNGAIVDFDKAIQLNPNFAEVYRGRGQAKYGLGDKNGAIVDYDKAIQLNPNYSRAYYNRGNAKSGLGDNQGAIVDYTEAIRINQNWEIRSLADAYTNRGLAKSELGIRRQSGSDR